MIQGCWEGHKLGPKSTKRRREGDVETSKSILQLWNAEPLKIPARADGAGATHTMQKSQKSPAISEESLWSPPSPGSPHAKAADHPGAPAALSTTRTSATL